MSNYLVRVRRRTGAPEGKGRIQEDHWFESMGAAWACRERALKMPLVTGVTVLVIVDERSKVPDELVR